MSKIHPGSVLTNKYGRVVTVIEVFSKTRYDGSEYKIVEVEDECNDVDVVLLDKMEQEFLQETE